MLPRRSTEIYPKELARDMREFFNSLMSDKIDAINLWELEVRARELLSPMAHDYYASGANDEITLRENRAAYERITLLPRMLVDVSVRDLSTTVLGEPVSMPILIAPLALQGLAHPDAENATIKAASTATTLTTLATFRRLRSRKPWRRLPDPFGFSFTFLGIGHSLPC
jgi:isopentenyl diphosphate isomerase/L-lactate dehydrogenase-like FMN-dependent dehydrogenase